MEAIRIGVVGTGYIGRRHCQIIAQHPDTRLAGVADVQPAAMQGIDAPHYDSLDALVQQAPCEVVCLCTPNYLHTGQALEVLASGRHVVIEKPMGLREADCLRVHEAALQAGRQVFVVMQNRFTPTALWLKELLDTGTLGRILMVQINCFWNRDDRYYIPGGWKGDLRQDGGVLFTQFSHFIDILYWLLGDIAEVQAQMDNLTHRHSTHLADSGQVQFRLKDSGALGSLHFSTSVWDRNLESSITLIGERGSVRVAGQYMNEVDYCHIADYQMPELPPANPPNLYGPYQGSAANHHYIFQNLVDTLRRGTPPTIDALQGAAVVRIIEQMYAAAR
ncbi:MAG: Gfo/Idh/MocA family oxidoreductase [Bacteroidetes bacterium]|nr:Gfo/Idh/MocA family oxidoreductase [Bacteroidota bacterium]